MNDDVTNVVVCRLSNETIVNCMRHDTRKPKQIRLMQQQTTRSITFSFQPIAGRNFHFRNCDPCPTPCISVKRILPTAVYRLSIFIISDATTHWAHTGLLVLFLRRSPEITFGGSISICKHSLRSKHTLTHTLIHIWHELLCIHIAFTSFGF